jgi:hypothetical protein
MLGDVAVVAATVLFLIAVPLLSATVRREKRRASA